jgi:hypothetical protein
MTTISTTTAATTTEEQAKEKDFFFNNDIDNSKLERKIAIATEGIINHAVRKLRGLERGGEKGEVV